jgi:agarase
MRRYRCNLFQVKLSLVLVALSCLAVKSWQSSACATQEKSRHRQTCFGVQKDPDGKYWFVDPQGNRFLSIGINNIQPEPWRPKTGSQYYDPVPSQFGGSFDAWKKDVFKILQEHGFNTLGAWSDGRLYDGPIYGTVCLYVAGHAHDRCLEGLRPGFAERIRENAKIIIDKYPHWDNVFGVFLDNEMPWYGHAAWGDIPNYTLLEVALSLPAEDGARRAATSFLKKRYSSIGALSEAWGKPVSSWDQLTFEYARSCLNKRTQEDRADFVEYAADTFYRTACETVRGMLPDKLILGTRFAGYVPEPVVRACGHYCDVVSFNNYRRSPSADPDMLARFWMWSGKKPLMVTEFSWRGEENTSGNPNSGGAGAVVKTQAERARNYKKYIEDLLSYPMVTGAHWFEFADQSPQGRFDGENSNYGIVDIRHRPYKEVLNAMKQTNARIKELHAESARVAPQSLPEPKSVVFEPSQRPERPPFVDLLKITPTEDWELYHAPDAVIEIHKAADHLGLKLKTGTDWGCGIIFFGPKSWAVPIGSQSATDLDGYSIIELDAEIPKSLTYAVFVDEAGVGPPDAQNYDTTVGDDGESFLIGPNQGLGGRRIIQFELNRLEPRLDWGNQQGLRKVDLHAIKGVSLYFYGGQANHSLKVYSIKLRR